jgi:hypothetical protein
MAKDFFEQELRKLFENSTVLSDIRFPGTICVARLTDTVNVKLAFVTLDRADHCAGIKVDMINRDSGESVDTTVFRFADILGKKAVPGNPNFTKGVYPHIRKNGEEYAWYAYKPMPQDFEAMADAVNDYLEIFKELRRRPKVTL